MDKLTISISRGDTIVPETVEDAKLTSKDNNSILSYVLGTIHSVADMELLSGKISEVQVCFGDEAHGFKAPEEPSSQDKRAEWSRYGFHWGPVLPLKQT